jgi:hypothetical protein
MNLCIQTHIDKEHGDHVSHQNKQLNASARNGVGDDKTCDGRFEIEAFKESKFALRTDRDCQRISHGERNAGDLERITLARALLNSRVCPDVTVARCGWLIAIHKSVPLS